MALAWQYQQAIQQAMSADGRRALMKGNVERNSASDRFGDLYRGMHGRGMIP